MTIDSIIPFPISNVEFLTPKQMQFVYSVVNDPAINTLMNLDNEFAANHPLKVDSSQCNDNTPLDKLQWVEMSEEEALRFFDKEYRRYCKLAVNGYHLRKNNLKAWQKDLEQALAIEGEEYWTSPLINKACNYKKAFVEIPKTSQRTKDMQFLLKWCKGIRSWIKQNPSGSAEGLLATIQSAPEIKKLYESGMLAVCTSKKYLHFNKADMYKVRNLFEITTTEGENALMEKLASYKLISYRTGEKPLSKSALSTSLYRSIGNKKTEDKENSKQLIDKHRMAREAKK